MQPRTGKALILASKPFEAEDVGRSWLELATSFAVYGACIAVVVWAPWLALKIAAAAFAGVVQFRFFSLYHDHVHGSVLAGSRLGQLVMSGIGLWILAPRSVWKETHNFHHWNNGKIEWAAIGSYPVLTVEQFAKASPGDRRSYLRARSALAILFGYFTVAIAGMCISAFRRAPKRHWAGPLALALHFGIFAALWWKFGLTLALLGWLVPVFFDHTFAAYLFYAQHNFPETKFFVRGTWDYTEAAVHGSSFLHMSRWMHWLTSNIGFHHVHHLNAKIPSYRLPEAMAALPELQAPHRTSFAIEDVRACLQLKVWDPEAGRMQP